MNRTISRLYISIRSVQLLVVVLFCILTLPACGGFATTVEPQENNQQEGLSKSTDKDELANPGITSEKARERYIKEFGEPIITFQKDPFSNELLVTIVTKRLTISSSKVNEDNLYWSYIYSSQKVMEKFAAGQTQDLEYAQKRLQAWDERWKKGNPFAGLTAWMKKSQEFLGNVVVGGADEPYSSEIAYFIRDVSGGNVLVASL